MMVTEDTTFRSSGEHYAPLTDFAVTLYSIIEQSNCIAPQTVSDRALFEFDMHLIRIVLPNMWQVS